MPHRNGVDLLNILEGFESFHFDATGARNARVVHQYVDPPEVFFGTCNQVLTICRHRHIGGYGKTARQFSGEFVQTISTARGNHHLGPHGMADFCESDTQTR